jgi:hypothetical protein
MLAVSATLRSAGESQGCYYHPHKMAARSAGKETEKTTLKFCLWHTKWWIYINMANGARVNLPTVPYICNVSETNPATGIYVFSWHSLVVKPLLYKGPRYVLLESELVWTLLLLLSNSGYFIYHHFKDKCKFLPGHTMKSYRRSRGIAPLILHIGIIWRLVVIFTHRPL